MGLMLYHQVVACNMIWHVKICVIVEFRESWLRLGCNTLEYKFPLAKRLEKSS
jgi:hypothetical protein